MRRVHTDGGSEYGGLPEVAQLGNVFPSPLVLNALPVAAYTCDADGLITHFNEHAARFWGRRPALNDPSDRYCGSFRLRSAGGQPIPHEECWMALALNNRTSYQAQEIVVERLNGERVTALAHASPFFDEEGKLQGALNVLVDLSERERAEADVQVSEARFRAAMEGSKDSFFILRADRDAKGEIEDFTFVDLNARGELLIGIPRAKAIGGRLLDLLPANRDLGFFDKYVQVVESGEPIVEEFGECAGGHVGAWFWQQVVPVGDGIAITTADLTERKQAEIDVEERFQQLALIHDLSTRVTRATRLEDAYDHSLEAMLAVSGADRASILLFDPDGVVRFKAWRALSEGYRRAVEGHSPWRRDEPEAVPIVIHDAETDASLGPYKEDILAEGIRALAFVPLAYEDRLLGKVMLYSGTPGAFTDGHVQLAQTIANHVAFAIGRKQAEQALRASEEDLRSLNESLEQRVEERTRALAAVNGALERSNRELQDFAYVASHDLQEPLRKIQSFAGMLAVSPGVTLDDEGRHFVSRMQAAAERMSGLIRDLLAFSRVRTQADAFAAVDLDSVLSGVLGDLETRLKETGGAVEAQRLGVLHADAVQMRQALLNLIGNALKFHRPGVPPLVRVHTEDGAPGIVHLVVEDNGIGFDEKYLDRIFSPFQRLHARHEFEGTGMGLAIVRRIAERHGGSITAKSQIGGGSVFTLTLPISRDGEL